MYKFLRKTLLFLLIPMVYFGANMLINYFIYDEHLVEIERTNVIIAGDSHPEKSLNPKYFKDAQNISQPGEPYVITYWKLKNIFKTMIPDTLIIGFAPHNITEYNDLKFSDERWSGEMFRRSYPIEEFDKISNTISVDYKTYYRILLKETGFYPKRNHVNYIGEYINTDKNDLSDSIFAVESHYYHKGKALSTSELSLNYLDSIVEISDSKSIELIMMSNPVHENYHKHIPVLIMDKYDDLITKYKTNHIIFNKTKESYPDSLYLNSDHLNDKGAERFTKELIEYLKS